MKGNISVVHTSPSAYPVPKIYVFTSLNEVQSADTPTDRDIYSLKTQRTPTLPPRVAPGEKNLSTTVPVCLACRAPDLPWQQGKCVCMGG